MTILVVEPDSDERRRISAWLDDAGYSDVMFCPGPSEPDYMCLGSIGADCPLAKAADVVVLDMNLRSDEALRGTPAWRLMLYYYDRGMRIVALAGDQDAVRPRPDEQLAVVDKPIDRSMFLDAIGSFVDAEAVRAGNPGGV